MSKKFTVTAQMITMLTTEIEAESLEEAQRIADVADGGDFIEIPNSGDWSIYDVSEKEEAGAEDV